MVDIRTISMAELLEDRAASRRDLFICRSLWPDAPLATQPRLLRRMNGNQRIVDAVNAEMKRRANLAV